MLPPEGAAYFQFSSFLLWFMRFALALFLGLSALSIGLVWIEPGPSSDVVATICGSVFGVFAVFIWNTLCRLRDRFAVSDNGVWSLPHKGALRFIAWRDVTKLRADDIMQRLLVSDETGAKPIRLDYQLDDFSALRTFVLGHTTPASRRITTRRPVFHRTRINKIIILASTTPLWALAWLSFRQGSFGPSVFFIAFASLGVLSIILDPLTLEIGQGVVIIAYPGWKRTIAFGDIVSVTLHDVSSRGNVWAVVTITLKSQKPIKLYRFREGSLALAETLQNALRRGGDSTETVK